MHRPEYRSLLDQITTLFTSDVFGAVSEFDEQEPMHIDITLFPASRGADVRSMSIWSRLGTQGGSCRSDEEHFAAYSDSVYD